MRRASQTLLFLLAAAPLSAQTAAVQLPSLSVVNTQIQTTVSYDAARSVYRYTYTVINPTTNAGDLMGIQIDLAGKTVHSQIDPDLQNNVQRDGALAATLWLQPSTTIPIGLTVPDPSLWMTGMTPDGDLALARRTAAASFARGTSTGGIVVESKFPPAIRAVRVIPDDRSWYDFARAYPEGTVFTPDSAERYDFKTTAIAPGELSDADLFDGGGQQPAEVNRFLRYAAPADNRVKLPAGTASTTVIVYYGKTIVPSTFAATLNGVDIASKFHPVPGGADAVVIPLASGSTKLIVSVTGAKASGGSGSDKDTFTFLVP